MYVPTIKLRQSHYKAGADLKVLFHLIMEHYFSEEVLAKSVAFGNRVIPSGKDVLDPSIVSAIKGIYKALLHPSQYPYCVAIVILFISLYSL